MDNQKLYFNLFSTHSIRFNNHNNISELYIPGRTLSYGLYELTLNVTMVNMSNLTSSSSVYVQITPSGIIANLIQYGTSMITQVEVNRIFNSIQENILLILMNNVFNASVSFNQNQHFLFLFSIDRIGNMNIIVGYMVYINFLI